MRTSTLITALTSVLAGALALTSMDASAQQRQNSVPMDSIQAPYAASSFIEGGLGPYEEDFETFTVGPLVPQGGWFSDFEPSVSVVDPGLAGSSRAALHTSDGSGFFGLDMRSPDFTPGSYLEITQVITGNETLYQISPIDRILGNYNTRIQFENDGSITVGQVNMAGDGLDFLPSGGTWTPGVPTTIAVEITDTAELLIFQDGTEIFVGTEVNFDFNGTLGNISGLDNLADNSGGPVNTQTWDNIRVLPEPPVMLPEARAVPVDHPWALAILILALSSVGILAVRRLT